MGQALSSDSRLHKVYLNAKVNMIFYFLTLALSFFSRRIFLDALGNDFVGLTGTLGNILGYLNLAELGIGTAISFTLFKPIQERDRYTISRIVSVFGHYYRNIGLAILVAGIVVSAFLPLIFRGTGFPLGVIYFAFYSFLASSMLGYFINYRSVLLSADQRNYVVTAYSSTANIIKMLIQMWVAMRYGSYYAWIAIELVFGGIHTVILNWKINSLYPWLRSHPALGRRVSKDYAHILESTKQIFVHKIKDFLLTQSDQLLIFAFVSLEMVALYNNYVLIIGKITTFFGTLTGGMSASVGSLVAEGDDAKITGVFWELMAANYFVGGFVCFCIYQLVTPFVQLWLGQEYLLGQLIVVMMLAILFISTTRGTVDNFLHARGNYADTWSAWAEGIINVSVTLVCGYYYGIAGILAGKLASLIPIIVVWKPLYLYRSGFHQNPWLYWAGTSRYYAAFAASALAVHMLLRWLDIDATAGWGWWIADAVVVSAVFGTVYAAAIILFTPGGNGLIQRLPLNKLGL